MILLRHGETMFNVIYGSSRRDPGIHDPKLTTWGRGQAERMATALRDRPIARLICSPYTRALETAAIIAGVVERPVIVDTRVRERGAFSCDVGTPRSELAATWTAFDFDHIDEIWWPVREELENEFLDRCRLFQRSMAQSPGWRETAVITHWGVIRALTGRRVANGALLTFDPTRQAVFPTDAGR